MVRRFGQAGGWVWAFVLLAVIFTTTGWGAVSYIQPGDWQYKDLDALAREGLVVGHPKAPLSTWTDKLTRFEAASLTLRAVQGVGQAYEAQGQKLRELAQAGESTLNQGQNQSAAPSAQAETASPLAGTAATTVTAEDLARVQKLVEEFRTELVGMGQKLTDLDNSVHLIMDMTKDIQKQLKAVSANQKKHQLYGYMQMRYQDDRADKGLTNGLSEFMLRRARVNMKGPVSAKMAYHIEMQFDAKEGTAAAGSKAQVRSAELIYKTAPGADLWIGQTKLPFGYELQDSVTTLWTAERAVFMDRLFPNQRDRGIYYDYRKSLASPRYDIGIFNGTGLNANDNNDRKNVMGRVMIPILPYGSVALSAYNGVNGAGAKAVRQDRYGLGSELAFGDTQFRAEYVTGKDLGHKVDGWYAQIGHPLMKSDEHPNLLFAKYDSYDENRDLSGDLFKRWSLGYWYQLDKATRLTAVWELRDAQKGYSQYDKWNGDAAYLQLQVKY